MCKDGFCDPLDVSEIERHKKCYKSIDTLTCQRFGSYWGKTSDLDTIIKLMYGLKFLAELCAVIIKNNTGNATMNVEQFVRTLFVTSPC